MAEDIIIIFPEIETLVRYTCSGKPATQVDDCFKRYHTLERHNQENFVKYYLNDYFQCCIILFKNEKGQNTREISAKF